MGFWDFVEDVFRTMIAAIAAILTAQQRAEPEPPSAPAHSVTYPEEYVRDHFYDRMNNYWHPAYKTPVNNLYHNEGRVYERRRY